MKTVTIASGKLQPEAIVAIAAVGDLLCVDMPLDFDLLATISPAKLAETIPESDFRKQILYVMGMLALIDGIPPQPQIQVLEEFASALGEHCNLIQQLRSLSSGGMPLLLYRFTYLRNTFINSPIYAQIKRSGVFNTVKSLATTWGLVEDQHLAQRYGTLATYPEGSLGLALHRYYLAHEFAMPGQKRSLPAAITSHFDLWTVAHESIPTLCDRWGIEPE